MSDPSKQFPNGHAGTERVVILQLLRKDRRRWTRAGLLRELYDVDEEAIMGSLWHLERLGLVLVGPKKVRASDGLRHVDTLDLICL
jgi:hypothetical protein